MSSLRPLPAALALFVLASAPALAGTTAEAVWTLFQDGVQEAGGSLTATASRRGNALVLTRGQIDLGDGATLMLPDFTLRQSPDGVVTLDLPPRFPLVIDLPPGPDNPDRLTLSVSAPDLLASFRDIGPEKIDVAFTASSISAALDPLDKTKLSVTAPPDVSFSLAAADVSLTWNSRFAEQADSTITARLGLGTLHADMRVDLPAEKSVGTMTLDLSAITADLDGLLPAGGAATLDKLEDNSGQNPIPALLALLDTGMHLKGKARTGPTAMVFDLPTTPDGPVFMEITLQSAVTEIALDRKGMLYDIGSGAVSMLFRGRTPEIPVDEFSLAATEMRETFRLGFPDAATPSPDWGVLYRFAGLTVSDSLWDLGDPRRTLPRDPMALVLDMTGTYTPDPRLMAGSWTPGPDELPFTAAAVTLTEALVQGIGITVSGTGDLAFDFTDKGARIDGTPVPEGKLSFLTTGANATIDRLSGMGLIPPEDLSSLRFGLMFLGRAVPGQTDQLATELEFRDGSFSLNGQKIR